MNSPAHDPHASHPGIRPLPEGDSSLVPEILSLPEPSLPETIFVGPQGIRMGWRLLLYFGLGAAILIVFQWLGRPYFAGRHGVANLMGDFYSELVSLIAAFVPALLMARLEHRSFGDYGLPRSGAFGKSFWVGAVWGLAGISALLLLLRMTHVFEFGPISLHGIRVWRFALFWAAYFLLVGLFEEFLLRGYFLFTLANRIGFWLAAVLLSLAFGAIHLFNKGENFTGALGAALIGLFFCLTLRRTGTLWFAVGFHAAWDWGETFLYGVPDSATTAPGHFLTPKFHGSDWLTGGAVGPEASALLLIVVAVLWLAFDRGYREAKVLAQRPAA